MKPVCQHSENEKNMKLLVKHLDSVHKVDNLIKIDAGSDEGQDANKRLSKAEKEVNNVLAKLSPSYVCKYLQNL